MIAPHQLNKILYRVQSLGYWLLHTLLLSSWWSSEHYFPGWHWRFSWHAYTIYNPMVYLSYVWLRVNYPRESFSKGFFPTQGSDAWQKSGLTWWFSLCEHFTLLTPSSTSKAPFPCFYACLCSLLTPGSCSLLTAGKSWDLFPDRKAKLVTAELSISFYSNFRKNVWISASCELIISICLISLPVLCLSSGQCSSNFFSGGLQQNKLYTLTLQVPGDLQVLLFIKCTINHF